MGFLSFGSRPKPQKFGFVPRYYDPDKEDLQERLKKYKNDEETSDDDAALAKSRIKGSFKRTGKVYNHNYRSSESYRSYNRKSNIRLLAILIALLFVSYILMVKYAPI